jgi:hypothetical protein
VPDGSVLVDLDIAVDPTHPALASFAPDAEGAYVLSLQVSDG